MDRKMSLNITTQDSEYNEVTIRLETEQIFLCVKEDSQIVAGCWLSAFEAQTIANALLKMADKLEMPNGIPIIENQSDYSIEKIRQEKQIPIGETYQAYEKTLNEQIMAIHDSGGGIHKKLQMQGGLLILVTKDVWENNKHLQSEYDSDGDSFMNIKRDSEGNWYLVDCLPF